MPTDSAMLPILPRISRLLASAAVTLFCSQCAFVAPHPLKTESIKRHQIYTAADSPVRIPANLYRPKSSVPTPVVVLIHGGSWTGGDHRWQMRKIANKLVSRGYYVMNVTYRTLPEWRYPAPLDDIGAAIDWIERNAENENIDPTRIALYGYSAGGHLALLRGLTDSRVSAIIGGSAPTDLAAFGPESAAVRLLGGTPQEHPDLFREASPLYRVTKDSPPVFLYQGRADTVVPPDQGRRMKAVLNERKIPNQLMELNRKGHITAFLFGGAAEDRAIDFLDQTLKKNP